MRYTLKKITEKPFLHSKNNVIIEANDQFINLTGYSRNELIGKSLNEITYMLRIDSQIYIENIQDEYSCYIFTQLYEPREVTIYCKYLEGKDEKMYFFKEKLNSRIEDKFQFLNKLILDAQIGVAIYGMKNLILLKANQLYLDLLSDPYNKKETTIGKKISNFVHSWEDSECKKVFMNVINTRKSFYRKEIKALIRNSEEFYVDANIIPISENGEIKYVISILDNVTEKVLLRKNSEEQAKVIKEQKDKLEAIIETMSDFLAVFDKDGRFIKYNKHGFFNISPLEDIEDLFKKLQLYDEYGSLVLKENLIIKKILRGEKVSECKIAIKVDNNLMYAEISGTPIYDSNGDFAAGILIIRNVTERVKSQENLLLKIQLDLLNNIIGNLGIGFARYSYPEFKIIDINNKAYNFLKQINPQIGTLESIKGNNYFDMFYSNEKNMYSEIIKNLEENKSGCYFYNRKAIVDGEEKFIKLMYQPLLGLNNSIIEIINIAVDITDEVKAKNKMEEALKMQEQIFANVSHELKTPLNVIFSTNQLMDFYLKKSAIEINKEKFVRNINIIKQNCHRFTKLINNIVDLSKIEAGFFKLNLSNENIVQITEDIVESASQYIKNKGVSIVFDTDIEEKIIACDPEKIQRVILNLISNAIKFSNSESNIFVIIFDKGDAVEIAVKDTGIGINKEYLHNVFRRFYQADKSLSRNAEGCGIGLALVKSIVELHGGKISVDSEVGEGSIFKIQLPARISEEVEVIEQTKFINNKIEMIDIEFSDIYSI